MIKTWLTVECIDISVSFYRLTNSSRSSISYLHYCVQAKMQDNRKLILTYLNCYISKS